MERAALVVAGEVGYREMTVDGLLARAGSHRARFYENYSNKEECFTAGYAREIDAMVERVLNAASRAPGWIAGFRLALEEAGAILEADPSLAKGVFIEAPAVSEGTRAKRIEVCERLSRAVDRARRETDGPRHSPPPFTSQFILSVGEAAVIKFLTQSECQRFGDLVPGLFHIGVSLYFDVEVAERELQKLRRAS
jgi:AcrR family transcriptional regulator